jgi:wyosine [tRNA(Phe)-imidazoG37] synthetase (radical SAM superfamily)
MIITPPFQHDPDKEGDKETNAALHGRRPQLTTAFGSPRDFLDNRYVYVVVSARARGLSVGVNMNPDQLCNYDCVYCEVNRSRPPTNGELRVEAMAEELEHTLDFLHHGELRKLDVYHSLPEDLGVPRHVTLSGDGEPTLCPRFKEAVQAVAHIRALGRVPFFKIVLITNGTALNQIPVQEGLKFLTRRDEIWIKLDAGTPEYHEKINRPKMPLETVLNNIILIGNERPVVIQSLFLSLDGEEPPAEEIDAYAARLKELHEAGAQISKVQIYSATRPTFHKNCRHLPLRVLSEIAHEVRDKTGLVIEVF